MTVDPERAPAKAEHAGKSVYFCCARCAEKFRADPERYLNAKSHEPMSRPGAAAQFVQLGQIKAAPPEALTAVASAARQPAAHEILLQQKPSAPRTAVYTCPMDPEVRQEHPGACPKCGMALEPDVPAAPATRTEYTCPMHPEIVRAEPGSCPICGMALEPRTATVEEEENPELVSMTRRFWFSLALTVPVLFLGMSAMIPGQPVHRALSMRAMGWIEFVLATPVVLWGGWPFFERGWASLVNRSLNMFTLIALGTGTAYAYSVVAVLFPGIFPLRSGRWARCRCISKRRPRSRRSSFSGRCSSCARAAARPPRFAHC